MAHVSSEKRLSGNDKSGVQATVHLPLSFKVISTQMHDDKQFSEVTDSVSFVFFTCRRFGASPSQHCVQVRINLCFTRFSQGLGDRDKPLPHR